MATGDDGDWSDPPRDGGRALALQLLQERVASLEDDNRILRELLSEALTALNRCTQNGARFQTRVEALRWALNEARTKRP